MLTVVDVQHARVIFISHLLAGPWIFDLWGATLLSREGLGGHCRFSRKPRDQALVIFGLRGKRSFGYDTKIILDFHMLHIVTFWSHTAADLHSSMLCDLCGEVNLARGSWYLLIRKTLPHRHRQSWRTYGSTCSKPHDHLYLACKKGTCQPVNGAWSLDAFCEFLRTCLEEQAFYQESCCPLTV